MSWPQTSRRLRLQTTTRARGLRLYSLALSYFLSLTLVKRSLYFLRMLQEKASQRAHSFGKRIVQLILGSSSCVRFTPKLDISQCECHVRFGSKADICSTPAHVRFGPIADRGHMENDLVALLAVGRERIFRKAVAKLGVTVDAQPHLSKEYAHGRAEQGIRVRGEP